MIYQMLAQALHPAHEMSFDLIFAGDLVLDEPQPDYWLAGIAPALRAVDVAIGHLEVPHTRHRSEMRSDVPAPGADPWHIFRRWRTRAFTRCRWPEITSPTAAPSGSPTRLRRWMLPASRTAAPVPTSLPQGLLASSSAASGRIALLSYNCVGPEESWATDTRAGCAYVRIETADGSRIAPASPLERADPASLADLAHDIASARTHDTLVIVALHKGIVHTPARLAPYERAVAHAAIDAGADIVIGHHAHIVRGIEIPSGQTDFPRPR